MQYDLNDQIKERRGDKEFQRERNSTKVPEEGGIRKREVKKASE